jgi:GT2 family glycosyltransferase
VRQLSVVIPSHNRADLLRLCLNSVTRHAPAGTEVVVVDDASPGGGASTVAASFPQVRCLRLPHRRGFCAAVNAGIAKATHAVVELLNDDTEVISGWAEAALAHFDDPRVAAVAPLVLRGPPHPTVAPRIDSAGDRYYVGGVAAKRGHGTVLTDRFLRAGSVFGASASSAFYRRAALQEVGGFPESFGAYFEDVDVAFRLHWAGYRAVYEPASRVWHRVSSSHGRSRRLLEQQARNEERVFWRNLPAAVLARALPMHAAVLLAKAWRRWHEGHLLPFVLGKLRVLSDAADLLRHRRRLHERRPVPDWPHWPIDMRYGAELRGSASRARALNSTT